MIQIASVGACRICLGRVGIDAFQDGQVHATHPEQSAGHVKGARTCVIVDDMASTGRTLCTAADALRQAGAGELYAVFTHAVMAPGAVDRIQEARFRGVFTTDSSPLAGELSWMETVPVAPQL